MQGKYERKHYKAIRRWVNFWQTALKGDVCVEITKLVKPQLMLSLKKCLANHISAQLYHYIPFSKQKQLFYLKNGLS